jgi:hypothetical protein
MQNITQQLATATTQLGGIATTAQGETEKKQIQNQNT